jgi:hypothetical protein
MLTRRRLASWLVKIERDCENREKRKCGPKVGVFAALRRERGDFEDISWRVILQ